MDWLRTFDEIRNLKLALARLDPRRGMPVLPPVGATHRALVSVERKLGRAIPPSYRAFLCEHDGWPQFFQGAGLLGSRHLVRGTYVDLARLMIDLPIAGDKTSLLPFGIDAQAETIFAFDASADRDGELEVVLVVNEIGARFVDFPEFVGFVRDAIAAELEERRETRATAARPPGRWPHRSFPSFADPMPAR